MKLKINGEDFDFEEGLSIEEILAKLEILDKVMAVALNTVIVKKEQWGKKIPVEDDKLEFLEFVGGG